jgi:hypothetical protein
MNTQTITLGQSLTCHHTGKAFTAARDGISFNYALDREGHVFSDEGVNLRELAQVEAHSGPVGCYVSSDAKRVTGWKGNTLGTITQATRGRVGFCRDGLYVTVKDAQGRYWHGRNAGPGMCITLRPSKA